MTDLACVRTLSVVVPCFNEASTIERSLERLLAIEDDSLKIQAIVVDDGSHDGSASVVGDFSRRDSRVVLVLHEKNRGKGAALRTGFARCCGDFISVQDADLEYDPADFKKLVVPIVEGWADVVYGSRFSEKRRVAGLKGLHRAGNLFLTAVSNLFTGLSLTDMETCYKVFRADVVRSLKLREDRFGIEPEITARTAALGVRIAELSISYEGRSYREGKKIGWRDGFRALYVMARCGFAGRRSVMVSAREAVKRG
jgi:glycosyltransferase involved in cell wall biosynthesis